MNKTISSKQQILNTVASLAFAGTLHDRKDNIPYEMVPGPKPTERCCIYKEREILRQRIKLAEGIPATGIVYGHHNFSPIQVIFSACADCPISAYTVTENCQNCIGKPCLDACKAGAISPGRYHSYIDTQKCKECGMCAKACPYNAIAYLRRPCQVACPVDAISYEENGISIIDDEKCIRCGKCIHSCPFEAIGTLSDMIYVIGAIKNSDTHVYLMAAPATEGQFGSDIDMNSIEQAALEIGFHGFVDVGIGADVVAAAEADEWEEAYGEGKKKTTSCCPAFVNMIRKHFPELEDCISGTVSPMCAVSRMIKAQDPGAITVFLGPCVAKKSEAHEFNIKGNADYVLTYSEFEALMQAKNVTLKPAEQSVQYASKPGKDFAVSGGITQAAVSSLREKNAEFNATVKIANGADECKTALTLMKFGKLPEDFIEGMSCEGGCINGPCHKAMTNIIKKNRSVIFDKYDDRGVRENVSLQNADEIPTRR